MSPPTVSAVFLPAGIQEKLTIPASTLEEKHSDLIQIESLNTKSHQILPKYLKISKREDLNLPFMHTC